MTITTLHPTRRTSATAPADSTTPAHRGLTGSRHHEQPPHKRTGEAGGPPWVDLCGLDYYARRRSLFATLSSLEPGEEVQLVSDRADDMSWLRYEWEARIPERYCWSLPQENNGTAQITVRLPEQRQ